MTLKRAIDARVELAFRGVHYELDHFALGNAGPFSEFGRGGIGGSIGIVAIGEVLSPCGEGRQPGDFGDVRGGLRVGEFEASLGPGAAPWVVAFAGGAGGGTQGRFVIWAHAGKIRRRAMVKNFIV